jgi:hypothetical protein
MNLSVSQSACKDACENCPARGNHARFPRSFINRPALQQYPKRMGLDREAPALAEKRTQGLALPNKGILRSTAGAEET